MIMLNTNKMLTNLNPVQSNAFVLSVHDIHIFQRKLV